MKPALLLVSDPVEESASSILDQLLAALPSERGDRLEVATGPTWAVAVIAPPVNEPTCGAHVLEIDTDIIVWAGEMFVPDSWPRNHAGPPLEQISRAVLERLRTHGIESLAEVDGGFCGAWYNRREGRWLIFNDKMGQIPVFWAIENERLVVSPQAWLTWRSLVAPLRISSTGVADLIRTQNMTEDHTLIEGVHWLPRRHALSHGADGTGYCRYWESNQESGQIQDEDEAVELYFERMTTTLRRHAGGESELLLGISGGLDSRLFLAFCEQIGHVPRCFTSGWPFYEDVRFGRKLARAAGAEYDFLALESTALVDRLERAIVETGGMQGAGHLAPLLPIQPYLQRHSGAVLLEGFFHGLIGGCAVPADDDIAPDRAPHESRWARQLLHSGGDFEFMNTLLHPSIARDSEQEWRGRIEQVFRSASFADPLARAEHTMVHGRMGRVDVLGTSLLRNDVLVRNPASDALMIDWHDLVAPRLRRGRAIYPAVLRRLFPRYARVPRADGCGGLPIATDRWLREYCWQMNRLQGWYARARYSTARRWGTSSKALRAWVFDVWRRSGRLSMLLDPSARILNWVQREPLLDLWNQARADALKAEPLLTLATLEYTCRWLESQASERVTCEAGSAIARANIREARIQAQRRTAGLCV